MKKAIGNYIKVAAIAAAALIGLAGCAKKEIKTVFDINVSDHIDEIDYSNLSVSVPQRPRLQMTMLNRLQTNSMLSWCRS